jgi:hypothetical protein
MFAHSIHIRSDAFVRLGVDSLSIDSVSGIYGSKFRLCYSLTTIDCMIWKKFRLENVSHKVVELLGYKPYDLPEDLISLRDILWGIMLYIRKYTTNDELYMTFYDWRLGILENLNRQMFNCGLSYELFSDTRQYYVISANSNRLNIHVGRPALKFNFA